MFSVEQSRRASFQAEIDIHAESLWSVALWLTKRWSAADTLLLKTVSKSYGSWPVFDKSISRKAWFFGILAGAYFDDRSMPPKPGTLLPLRTFELAAEASGQGRTRTSPLNSQELATLVQLSDASIKGAIARLSPESRFLLLLRFREKFSYADIAYITALREDEVKSRLSNLRRHTPRYILRQTDRVAVSLDNISSARPDRGHRTAPLVDGSVAFGAVSQLDNESGVVADSVSNQLSRQSPRHDRDSSL
jgi:DNA-directed RNA polymerase specialized sigma24 family protein